MWCLLAVVVLMSTSKVTDHPVLSAWRARPKRKRPGSAALVGRCPCPRRSIPGRRAMKSASWVACGGRLSNAGDSAP